ncbi:MAG: class I SAM-dependent methyltransferase [Thermotoga sp.]|nr:MAG: class I SAM-dependent methyltransferase [Thermotoga sp.]HDM69815.1 class I SAM-dependent methyltransferase [Thermotogales bacterium]
MKRFVVTTSHKPKREQVVLARRIADELNCRYVSRRRLSDIKDEIDFYYVVEKERVVLRFGNEVLFFHPSMAKVRYINIKKGMGDHLIEALKLEGNELILDATFGLGSEAILMANFLKDGKVVGLEASKHIYTIVKYGFKFYKPKEKWITKALKKIEILNEDFKSFIRKSKDKSFDIVYCDPMFENPIYESDSMNPLRPFAVYDTVDEEDVEEMLRVARKRIVLKSRVGDGLFERIKVDEIIGGKRLIMYGVIEVKG